MTLPSQLLIVHTKLPVSADVAYSPLASHSKSNPLDAPL
jgi:hypothetical protein